MHKVLLAFALLSVTFAGCLEDEPTAELPVESDWTCEATAVEDAGIHIVNTSFDPINEDRENFAFDFNSTNVRTCSLAAIGHTPLRFAADGSPDPHGYIGEIDMKPEYDLGAVAVLGAGGEMPTIYVLDISDRSSPEVLSKIEMPGTYLVDVKISDDGGRLFVASQAIPSVGETAYLTAGPYASTGFTVYDISDPASPSYVVNIPDSQVGCHMLNHEIVGTTHVVACVSQQIRLHAFDDTAGTFSYIGFVDYLPNSGPAGLPVPSGIPAVGDPTSGQLSSGPHDMNIQRDPVTGDLIMIVSHWDTGLRVVDLNDAPAATELGSWNGEGAKYYEGNVHTAMMFYAGGTRYIMASPEYTSSTSTVPSMWILDATDYSDLKLVAEWYHPGEHPSHGLYLTTHQWQVAPVGDVNTTDVRVYLTMNHGGLWVLGFDEMLQGDLQGAIKGFHLGRTPLDADTVITQNAVLSTWDVNVADGYIYGSDRATGLWVFQYQEDELGDETLTGFS